MLPPDDFDPPVGVAKTLEPGLRRIVADNPSPMTYRGTNTYLLGTRALAVIDPGPASQSHLAAILHAHLDHSPLARQLAQACGAPILAFGGPTSGRSPIMESLAQATQIGGGEGIDTIFAPNQIVHDGQDILGDGWTLTAIHTPGHIGNHLSFGWNDACFTADHVMGWASSLVSPPDGDLTDFMTSCARLQRIDWRIFYPGHGAPVANPAARLEWLVSHRQTREKSILDVLANGPATAEALAAQIYTETPTALLGAATRNVLAHLVDLTGKNLVSVVGPLSASAEFQRN
jgi:glyoxylase-like metal-dependent hydrolase (beta-lactamase superfamily II)